MVLVKLDGDWPAATKVENAYGLGMIPPDAYQQLPQKGVYPDIASMDTSDELWNNPQPRFGRGTLQTVCNLCIHSWIVSMLKPQGK